MWDIDRQTNSPNFDSFKTTTTTKVNMPPRHFILNKPAINVEQPPASIWTVDVCSVYPPDMPNDDNDDNDVMSQWTCQMNFDNRIDAEDFIGRLNGLYLGGGRKLEVKFHGKDAEDDDYQTMDLTLLRIINMTIEKVVTYGSKFEHALMKREFYNPQFSFLFDSRQIMHSYYNRRVIDLLDDAYSLDRMTIPIPIPILGEINSLHLRVLLQNVTRRRGSIARVMAFALEHVNCSNEVGQMIYDSIIHDPAPKTSAEIRSRMARVYIIHDIIANQPPLLPYSKVFDPMIQNIIHFFNNLTCSSMTKQRLNNQLNRLILK